MLRSPITSVVLGFAGIGANAASFIPLGYLPGGTYSSLAWDVSADGSVVVGVGGTAAGDEAFRWTSAGGMAGLGRRILAIATILGGLSAIWYFRNEILGWWRSRKPVPRPLVPLAQNPTRERVLDTVFRSDPQNDWIRANSNVRSVASYRHDANLRFVMEHSEEGVQCDDFRETWSNPHPDKSATGYWCDLYYAATMLDRFILVGVDGGRALIPIPKDGPNGDRAAMIRPLDYQVGRIFDTLRTLDEYIRRSGLQVNRDAL